MMTQEMRQALLDTQSPLQQKLVPFLRRRIDSAEDHWGKRHSRWREAEELYRAYRPADEQDQKTRAESLTQGVEKIVVPYSYATMQSILAFFMSIICERTPIIPVRGDGPWDVTPAGYMESVLHYQMENMWPPGTLIIFQWLLDAWRYGVGVIKNLYTVREWVDLVRTFSTDPLTGQQMDQLQEEDVTAYEGNEALNISPFDWYPDPGRPMSDFQRGEFVFHQTRRSWTEMLVREQEGVYVGVRDLPRGMVTGADRGSSGTGRYTGGFEDNSAIPRLVGMDSPYGDDSRRAEDRKAYCQLDEGWCWITPEQMEKLELRPFAPTSLSQSPRLWVFTLGNRTRCIRAEPANLPGRRFPFEIIEPNYDVYSPSNVGIIETTRGLQYHLSWLFNSRMMAVRKTLNNELVVDPSMIEEADLLDPKPGKLLRLTRAAQNSQSIDKAVFPLPVVDVTASHHQDSQVIREIGEEVTGASRLLMGLSNTGRRAATEVQGQLQLSSGRMKMLAELIVCQGLRPWAHQMSRNTQVFMTSSINIRVQQALASILGQQTAQIDPHLLQGSFTYPILESGIPTDKMAEQQIWRELFTTGMQTGLATPALQTVNWIAVFARFLQTMGIRNLQDYMQPGAGTPQMQVMPDQQVQAQAQQGNLVPTPSVEPTMTSDQFPMQMNPLSGNGGRTGM
jgi:hypothetical protein